MSSILFFLVSLLASIAGAICGIGGGVIIKPRTLRRRHDWAQAMRKEKLDAGFADPIPADKIGPGRKGRRMIVFPKRMCYTESTGASLNKFNGENAV